jgi:hypothetical protein
MRLIMIFVLCFVLLLEGVLFVLFTSPGNDLLLPFANSYLEQKVPQAKVVLKKFRLKPGSIGLIAELNDAIDVRAKGDINLFSQQFDINYTIDTEEIKTPTLTIKEHITIKGNTKGHADDMQIEGRGVAFKSAIRYGVSLIKQNPKNIKIDIKDADLQSLLIVAGQKPYATGRVSLHANMPDFAPLNPQIDAIFAIKNGVFNNTHIAKDFNITLPTHSRYQTHFVIKTQERRVTFDGSFNSDLANLALKEGKYHLLSNTLSTGYHLVIPKLEKLSNITKAPLRGEFVMDGTASLKNSLPTVTGRTQSFGGTMDFSYNADTLTAVLKKIHNTTLLYKLGQPKYLSGLTTANAKLTSLKNLTGSFKVQTSGNANRAAIKKAFDLDLGKKFLLNAGIKGKLKEQKLFATLITKTSMANLKATAIQYDLKKALFTSKYLIDIPDMGKLKPLTGKAFKGDMRISGQIKQAKDLVVTGEGKEFGGSIDFRLLNDQFKANVTGATVSKVMHMLDYPQVLEAITKAKVDYNIATASGTLHAKLDNARILPSKLTALLKQFKIIDLAKERFNNSTFDAKITKKLIDFTLDAKNRNNYLLVKHGKLIKKTGAINANIEMRIKGKDLQATIRGTTDSPKVSLDGSKYLEEKLKEKVLKSKTGKKLKKRLEKKLKGKTGSKIKDLVNGMF